MHQGPQIENENYKLKSFVNLYIVKALTRKPKLTLTITSGYFHPKHTNHNVGWFSPRDHAAPTPVWVEISRG